MRHLIPTLAVTAMIGNATAQSPTVTFHPVGSTGNLLTSESRQHWVEVARKIQRVDEKSDRVTQSLGLPPVHAIPSLATAKAAAPKLLQRVVDGQKSVLLIPERRRGGLMLNGEAGQ
jgi:hypothetical protein